MAVPGLIKLLNSMSYGTQALNGRIGRANFVDNVGND